MAPEDARRLFASRIGFSNSPHCLRQRSSSAILIRRPRPHMLDLCVGMDRRGRVEQTGLFMFVLIRILGHYCLLDINMRWNSIRAHCTKHRNIGVCCTLFLVRKLIPGLAGSSVLTRLWKNPWFCLRIADVQAHPSRLIEPGLLSPARIACLEQACTLSSEWPFFRTSTPTEYGSIRQSGLTCCCRTVLAPQP